MPLQMVREWSERCSWSSCEEHLICRHFRFKLFKTGCAVLKFKPKIRSYRAVRRPRSVPRRYERISCEKTFFSGLMSGHSCWACSSRPAGYLPRSNTESSPCPPGEPSDRGGHRVSWSGCRRGRRSAERLPGCRHFPENS